jgi:hypothetical protein
MKPICRSSLAVIFVSILAALSQGCASYIASGSARTLDAGKSQVSVNAGLLGVTSMPQVQVGGRRGLTDDLEIGGAFWNSGVRMDGKLALVRPEAASSGLNVALNPMLAMWNAGFPSEGIVSVQLPVLLGYRTEGREVFVGPRVSLEHSIDGVTASPEVLLGTTAGLRVRVVDGFYFVPELACMVASRRPAFPTFDKPGASFQGSLGFQFGAH